MPPRVLWRRGLVLAALGSAVFIGGYALFRQVGNIPANGAIPRIRADPSPFKEKPDNPGGWSLSGQDILIFQRLHPGVAPTTVERLLPPHEEPMLLPRAPPVPVPPEPVVPPLLRVPQPVPAEPVPQTAAMSLPPRTAEGTSQAGIVPPLLRSGAHLQLGSLITEDAARAEWARLTRRFPDALGDLSPTIARVQVGDRAVFRVTVGPVEEIRSLAICDELRAANAPCVILRP